MLVFNFRLNFIDNEKRAGKIFVSLTIVGDKGEVVKVDKNIDVREKQDSPSH